MCVTPVCGCALCMCPILLNKSMLLQKEIEERHQELKKEVKNILSLYANVPSKVLDFVDKIQQVGVGYHFEAEIEDILQQTYNDQNFDENHCENLYYNSLRFRLLRQAGFLVSPGIAYLIHVTLLFYFTVHFSCQAVQIILYLLIRRF